MKRVSNTERRALQIAIVVASIVPLTAGGYGALFGVDLFDVAVSDRSVDSHMRYLSGLLLGIGLAFLTTVPNIERQTARFRLLAAIVVLGGIARAIGVAVLGLPSTSHLFGLTMEVAVVPLLVAWQGRVAACQNAAGAKVP